MLATAVTGPLLVWWWAALAAGLVVAVVVAALLQRLLTTVRQIETGANAIWTTGKEVAGNTSTTWMLERAAGATEEIRAEIDRQEQMLRGKG